MEKVLTDDGSFTFRNMDVDETYHSHSGAANEARLKYAGPSGILEIAKAAEPDATMRILDYCFGLGYNSAAAIDAIRAVNPDVAIEIVALELDQGILDHACTIDAPFESFQLVKKACVSHDVKEGGVHLKIVLGDARKTINQLDGSFDAVFFDPFSPQKAPDMWTQGVFASLFSIMKPGAKLTTYSCARIVRDNLRSAGFIVQDGPIIGRRGPSTIASKPNI